MTKCELLKIVHERFEYIENLIATKQVEYADEDDALIQFKKAGWILGEHPLHALAGMMSKHTASIYRMIKDPSIFPQTVWIEKITDQIAYLVLLEALLKDHLWRYQRDGEE